MIRIRYRRSPELSARSRALREAFRRVRRSTWTRRELALRYVTDVGANWTIA